MTPRSSDGESETELVVLSDGDDRDDTTPPVGPLHLGASEELECMWHDVPAAIPPVLMAGLQNHVESSIYYCGSRIQYVWYRDLPQLLLMDGTGREYLTLPVDQDYVQVFREGGHMAFSIAEPAKVLHAIFLPFVLAALRTRPKTPVEASKDKWVEADKTLAAQMQDTISDARRSTSLRVNARLIPVLSSGTGFSQYFQGPSPHRLCHPRSIKTCSTSSIARYPVRTCRTKHGNVLLRTIIGRCSCRYSWPRILPRSQIARCLR